MAMMMIKPAARGAHSQVLKRDADSPT